VPAGPPSDPSGEVDLNQVVAYNVREARELRGWTQDDLALRLEPYLGQRMTQAGVSSIERAWDGERKREFDAHELLIFSLVFDLPMLWFLLPPPGDDRMMRATTRPVGEIYAHLFGMPHQLDEMYDKLARLSITNPDPTDAALRRLSGNDTNAAKWSYRERRKELLLALARQHADDFDTAVEELGRTFDHLRQVGFRGFLAETTDDRDLARATPAKTDSSPPTGTASTAEAQAAETRLGTGRSDDVPSPDRNGPLANTRRRKAGGGRRTQEK
jgi:hypothetical protein